MSVAVCDGRSPRPSPGSQGRTTRGGVICALFAALILAGCLGERQPATSAGESDQGGPRPSVALRVLVVNEPELAEAIDRLRGEWSERTGGELLAAAIGWKDLSAAKTLDADVLVFPSRYLGELCLRDWLRPVRPHVLESEDLDWADIFPLIRRESIRWDGQVMALPLGVDLPRPGQPTEDQPSISLLLQAASEAVTSERLGVLFDPETMKPRITERPFIDAIQRLAESSDETLPVDSADAPPVPVLGFNDRLAAVTRSSRNAASAFQLLAWLAGPEISSQIARAGDGAMPVRRSLASSPAWYDRTLSSQERAETAQALEAALQQRAYLLVPRIPGVDQYMAALDDAVRAAVFAEAEPQRALQQAAANWEQITAAHGRDAQRQAYRKHLGIEEQ